ncbi:putative ABC transporter substrate-binding protein [Arthrobacter crystallopoietes BAB-32]|uniref:Putative ABC transporter substrate-binding protein n=1 Tax=Arthrobacter crystallopoietes BAB-32 TaxID=1246476 RepID=N1UTW5_9MICC|nr:ABC transporter substrate-binding protein [Arthrobacter crystallopoietes]EMY33846.1 putative ABC transporter substrate-binding protein [Arthrobacter crystallopoietes BAB-32]
MKTVPFLPVAAATVLVLALTGCAGNADGATGPAKAAGYPLTIVNCGAEVTLQAPPERVVMLESSPVTYLRELGVMDKVVARAGAYPSEYFDAVTRADLDRIPLLTDKLDTSGHLQISQEVVLAQEPDLVLGSAENLNRETLAAAGIPLLQHPSFCPQGLDGAPDFGTINDQLRTYGQIFGVEDRAATAANELADRVEQISAEVDGAGQRTAAVLYPTLGGGTIYAYGTRSMAQPQLEAAGFENVFDDVDERVFEVTREELIGRNPDVLILLHAEGDPSKVAEAVTSMKGASSITAVANGDLMVQLFNFTEPPSPLAVTGLERIIERFEQ